MKLSENANYKNYLRYREADEYGLAIESLRACLDDLRGHEYEALYRADLLQRIGDLFLRRGERDKAFAAHNEALRADPASLIIKLHFAAFLARAGEHATAISECDRIVKDVTDHPFAETEDDLGSEYYLREAKKLKDACLT